MLRWLVARSCIPVFSVVLLAGCDAPASPDPAPKPAQPPALDTTPATTNTPAPAPVANTDGPTEPLQWRGPSRYDLRVDDLVVGAGLKVPGEPWSEDHDGSHARFKSPAGSVLEVRLKSGEAATKPRHERQSRHQEHAVPLQTPYKVICEFSLVDEEASLFDPLEHQCSELSIEFEPDARARWEIVLNPKTVSMARRDELDIRYRVTNEGTDPLDAKAYSLDWKVNGEGSMSLSLAFNNGGYPRIWRQLPSGDSIEDRRVGVHIADSPGEYVITLHHLDREVAKATLRVLP